MPVNICIYLNRKFSSRAPASKLAELKEGASSIPQEGILISALSIQDNCPLMNVEV